MSNQQQQNPVPTPSLLTPPVGPSLQEQIPEPMPAQSFATMSDHEFLTRAFINFAGDLIAKGGDTRFAISTALQAAREALGAMIALGVVREINVTPEGQPLWKQPAVPQPAGGTRQNVTLG